MNNPTFFHQNHVIQWSVFISFDQNHFMKWSVKLLGVRLYSELALPACYVQCSNTTQSEHVDTSVFCINLLNLLESSVGFKKLMKIIQIDPQIANGFKYSTLAHTWLIDSVSSLVSPLEKL